MLNIQHFLNIVTSPYGMWRGQRCIGVTSVCHVYWEAEPGQGHVAGCGSSVWPRAGGRRTWQAWTGHYQEMELSKQEMEFFWPVHQEASGLPVPHPHQCQQHRSSQDDQACETTGNGNIHHFEPLRKSAAETVVQHLVLVADTLRSQPRQWAHQVLILDTWHIYTRVPQPHTCSS